MNIKKLLDIGIINTIRMNVYYLGGVKGLIKPRILASRNLKINLLRGSCRFEGTGFIQVGLGYVGLFDNKYQRTLWENSGEIIFKGKCSFGPGSRIINHGELTIGDNFIITASSVICCYKSIKIGNDVLCSWNCRIMDTDFHKIYSQVSEEILNPDKPIEIGDHVWICSDSQIFKGVKVSNNIVIAGNSKVTKSLLGENSIYKDNMIIKANIRWHA